MEDEILRDTSTSISTRPGCHEVTRAERAVRPVGTGHNFRTGGVSSSTTTPSSDGGFRSSPLSNVASRSAILTCELNLTRGSAPCRRSIQTRGPASRTSALGSLHLLDLPIGRSRTTYSADRARERNCSQQKSPKPSTLGLPAIHLATHICRRCRSWWISRWVASKRRTIRFCHARPDRESRRAGGCLRCRFNS